MREEGAGVARSRWVEVEEGAGAAGSRCVEEGADAS